MIRVMIENDQTRHEPMLRIEATLGTAFAALPRPVQRRIVEEKLTRALAEAQSFLDRAPELAVPA